MDITMDDDDDEENPADQDDDNNAFGDANSDDEGQVMCDDGDSLDEDESPDW